MISTNRILAVKRRLIRVGVTAEADVDCPDASSCEDSLCVDDTHSDSDSRFLSFLAEAIVNPMLFNDGTTVNILCEAALQSDGVLGPQQRRITQHT